MATEAAKSGKIHQIIGAVVDVVCADAKICGYDSEFVLTRPATEIRDRAAPCHS
jgi:hypothetical protein